MGQLKEKEMKTLDDYVSSVFNFSPIFCLFSTSSSDDFCFSDGSFSNYVSLKTACKE